MELAENRPSKWNRDARFRDALAAALTETHKHLSAAARTAMYQAAIAGNLAAFDRIREVERSIEALTRPADPGTGMPANLSGVQVHIHAIPDRAPFSSLPPPLELPAAPSGASTPPAPAK